MYELHVSISGPKDCDLPKAALTALHAGVNSFGQLPVGPNLADLGGGAGGGGSSGGVPVGGGVARLHISGGLCDNSNALNGGNGSSGNGNGNNNNGNGNGNNNNSMQQQDQVSRPALYRKRRRERESERGRVSLWQERGCVIAPS